MSALPEGRPSNQERWEPYRETLRRLYLAEKKTLKEVKEDMERLYSFKATPWEFENKLKAWGFTKYLKKEDWPIIDSHMTKRKREGKESEVLLHDVLIPPAKIQKHTLRYRDISCDQGNAALGKLPNGVVIRTPPASPATNFQITALTTASTETRDGTLTLPRSRSPSFPGDFLGPLSRIPELGVGGECRDLIARRSISPERGLRMPSGRSTPDFSDQFCHYQFFNELSLNKGNHSHPGDFIFTQDCRLQQSQDMMIIENDSFLTDVDLFVRSEFNNTPDSERSQIVLSSWSKRHSIAVDNVPWFLFQRQIKAHGRSTFNAMTDQFFYSIVTSSDLTIASPSLSQDGLSLSDRRKFLYGLLPGSVETNAASELASILQDMVPESFDGEIEKKLQTLLDPSIGCSILQVAEFVLYFLSNSILNEDKVDEFLKWVMQQESTELLKALFKMNNPTVHAVSCRLLESTVRCGNASNLQTLMDSGIDKTILSGRSGGRYLQLALHKKYGQVEIGRILVDNGADVNLVGDPSYVFSPPPLYLAIELEPCDLDLIRRLIEAKPDVNFLVCGVLAPLSAAVGKVETQVVSLLLEAGANVDIGQVEEESILDWTYVKQMHLHQMLLPFSQKARTSLTIHGVLSAAHHGCKGLLHYLSTKDRKDDPRKQETLESALCFEAEWRGKTKIITTLLEFGVDPNTRTVREERTTPLANAAEQNNMPLVTLLLDAGAEVDECALLATIGNLHGLEMLIYLISQCADIKRFGGGALKLAIYREQLPSIRLLVSSGVDMNVCIDDQQSQTPLQLAALEGKLALVQYFVNAGADINALSEYSKGVTALHGAAKSGKINVVKLLLDAGADVNAQARKGYYNTVLESALECWVDKLPPEREEIFELLLRKGAHINGPKKRRCPKWNTALTILISKSAGQKLIQLALNAGADVNEAGGGREARTPIQAAAEVGNFDLVKQLFEKGADIHAASAIDCGRTTLQAACCNIIPNAKLVEFLLQERADVNAPAGLKGGLTALQGAAIRGHMGIVARLLDAGADVNAEPAAADGRTALDGAAEHGRLDMVQFLLNLGAQSGKTAKSGKAKNEKFSSAIELARKNGHFAVADLLESQ